MNRRTKRIHLMTTALLLAMFALLSSEMASAQTTQPAPADNHLSKTYENGIESHGDGEFIPGEILVGYRRDQVTASSLQSRLGMEAVEALDLHGLDGETGDAGVSGYVMSVPVGSEWETIEQLLDDPTVAFATPNWVVRAAGQRSLQQNGKASIETAFEVNDPYYAAQEPDPKPFQQWYQQRINASRAWQLALELRDPADPPIRVAIIDSGVYTDHAELKPHLLPGASYVEDTLANRGCYVGPLPIDDFGHGTHMAGLIGATLNNNRGIAGVAPWVKIDPYKILNCRGSGSMDDLAQAIRDATDNGAKIINLSVEARDTTSVLDAAVNYANASGVLLIASAGNWGKSGSVAYPAALNKVIAVAATTVDDSHASYSAEGPQVEIAAPGGEQTSREAQIFSTWSRYPGATCGTGLQLDEDGNAYCNAAGTSMAGAVVSGVAALIWGLDPAKTSEEVRAILSATATPLDASREQVGSGRVDAHAAVRRLVPSALQPSVGRVALYSTAESEPFMTTVALTNPSLYPVAWEAELSENEAWIELAGTNSLKESGSIRYGEPAYVSMVISPSLLIGGIGIDNLMLSADAETGPTVNPLQIILSVYEYQMRFPQIVIGAAVRSQMSTASTAFEWELPADPDDRNAIPAPGGGSVEAELPFDFPMGQEDHRYVRIHSDGFVTLPVEDLSSLPPNVCLPGPGGPQNAIFGWMANLDPSQPGAELATFPVGTDRFVIEYLDVPSAFGVTPAYTVSFQIVLFNNGDIRLNYLNAPDDYDLPPLAAIGVSTVDGRFHNRIYCNDGNTTLGKTPHPQQTLRIKPKDIY